MWDRCPTSCLNWDHWRTHTSSPSPPCCPPSAPSRLLTPPPPSPVHVKPMRVKASPSMTFVPSSGLTRPAPILHRQPPETITTVQLGPQSPRSLRSPVKTSTTSLPPEDQTLKGSVVSQNASLLWGPCSRCPRSPRVPQQVVKGADL